MDQATQLRNIIKKNAENADSAQKAARVFTVTSGKGGVGKSNVAINLAVEFKKQGKRVIIFDADFGLANIEVMFGAIPKHNLADLIFRGMPMKDIITVGPMDIGFISGGCGIAQLSALEKPQLEFLVSNLAELDKLADIVIIDTGAGISDQVLDFLVASKEILLVTTPEPTSITDSYSLLKALSRHENYDRAKTVVRMISNRVEDTEEGRQLFSKLNTVVERYLKVPVEFLGVVPQDNLLSRAVISQSPICIQNPTARSAKAFADLAAILLNNEKTQREIKRGMAGFFSAFLQSKRNK